MKKLVNILLELKLEKDKLYNLSNSELNTYSVDIFNLIDNAYRQVGGNATIKSPNDIKNNRYFKVADVDDDQDIDVVIFGKNTEHGDKQSGFGHDGSKTAKRFSLSNTISVLKQKGNYVEASDKLHDIMVNNNVPIIKDEQTIKKVLSKYDITLLGDGWYIRNIGGKKYKKRLLGII